MSAYLPGTFLRDTRGVTLADGGGVTWTFDGATNTLTAAVASGGVAGFNESVDDRVAALIQNGTGISWTYNDASNTLTPAVSLGSFSTADLAEGANLYFTDERAQDAVAGMIADSTTIDFTYNDAGNSFTASVIANSIANTHLRQSGGLSVVGRSANTTGNVADIVAGADDRILRRVSSVLDFGQLTVGMAPDDVWTYAKIQNVSAANRILGRITSGAGDIEELTAANVATILAAITPTWTGQHIFSRSGITLSDSTIVLSANNPTIYMVDANGAANNSRTRMQTNAGVWSVQAINDAETVARTGIQMTLNGGGVSDVSLGNATDNPTFSFLGTGLMTVGGSIRLNAQGQTTGTATATFSASNKPGANNKTSPDTWMPINLNGTVYYFPGFLA